MPAQYMRWKSIVFFTAILIITPIAIIFASLLSPDTEVWSHLIDTVLLDYISNSLLLMLGVGFGSIVLGTYLAWCMSEYDFAGRNVLQWLLLLPLAMPAYIIAYTYTGMLDFAGPLQSALRASFAWQANDYWFPQVRSLGGAIVLMSLVLYPYVYILARTAFSEQSMRYSEVSQIAGKSKFYHVMHISLPLARPAILTGAALAMMEALADFGTVEYFGISTFTTGIYRTWFGMGELGTASQLSALLCMFVFVLLALEKHSRKHHKTYVSRQGSLQQIKRVRGLKAGVILSTCILPVLFGFLIPFFQLLAWSVRYVSSSDLQGYLTLILNSIMLATISALCIVAIALLLSYAKRFIQRAWVNRMVALVGLGYAMPGTVIAIGVLAPAGWLDRQLNQFTLLFDYQVGLLFSGTLLTLVFAYLVRFMSVALNNTESGLARISSSMDEVAHCLGDSKWQMMKKVHLPLLKASLLSAFLLVFVDVLKELPATLILRPFNFNTLAVKTFELASDERLIEAALPAISIVLVGIIPVVILTKVLDKVQNHHA